MSSRRAQLIANLEKGLHYFSMGQYPEARAHWEKALEIDPNNAQAREFMQYVAGSNKAAAVSPDPAGGRSSAATMPHDDAGTSPVKDLSTRHIPMQQLDIHDPTAMPPADAEPLAPGNPGVGVAPTHNFLPPTKHNIEDLLVPDSSGPSPGFSTEQMSMGGLSLMPPSLGSFSLMDQGSSLLDQSGANPLLGGAEGSGSHPLFATPPPASRQGIPAPSKAASPAPPPQRTPSPAPAASPAEAAAAHPPMSIPSASLSTQDLFASERPGAPSAPAPSGVAPAGTGSSSGMADPTFDPHKPMHNPRSTLPAGAMPFVPDAESLAPSGDVPALYDEDELKELQARSAPVSQPPKKNPRVTLPPQPPQPPQSTGALASPSSSGLSPVDIADFIDSQEDLGKSPRDEHTPQTTPTPDSAAQESQASAAIGAYDKTAAEEPRSPQADDSRPAPQASSTPAEADADSRRSGDLSTNDFSDFVDIDRLIESEENMAAVKSSSESLEATHGAEQDPARASATPSQETAQQLASTLKSDSFDVLMTPPPIAIHNLPPKPPEEVGDEPTDATISRTAATLEPEHAPELATPEGEAGTEHPRDDALGLAGDVAEAYEDTPSDEFPAANEALLGQPDSSPSASFGDFSFREEDSIEVDEPHNDPHGRPPPKHAPHRADQMNLMESPTPSGELVGAADDSLDYEAPYSLEGSQLEFTGLPELPEQRAQEAGQVISLDLQGTDEPYIQDKQASPILTYRSRSPEAPLQEGQGYMSTARDMPPYRETPSESDEQFAQQDPFDRPYEDPFEEDQTPAPSSRDASDYHGSETSRASSTPDPYASTQAANSYQHPYNASSAPSSTPGYDQGNYNQTAHAPSSSQPYDNYGQGGYEQGGYEQGGYEQGGYGQAGYDQGGYDQGSYNQGTQNQDYHPYGSSQEQSYNADASANATYTSSTNTPGYGYQEEPSYGGDPGHYEPHGSQGNYNQHGAQHAYGDQSHIDQSYGSQADYGQADYGQTGYDQQYNHQGNYGDQAGYGAQGNYGDQGNYGSHADYGSQADYGQADYGDQAGYENQQPDYGSSSDYGSQGGYDPYAQTAGPGQASHDPYAQTAGPGDFGEDPYAHTMTPTPSEPYDQTYRGGQETPSYGAPQASSHEPDEFDFVELEEFEDDGVFNDDPTPDAPMPSIHEQLAHLPSAALRHDYVEHEAGAPEPAPEQPNEDLGEVEILLTGAKDLLAEEDYRSAMELLEMAKSQAPDNAEVTRLYETCKAEVEQIYLSEITSLDLVPHIKCTMDEIMRLNIGHRVGFLISQIDGRTSLSDLMILTGFEETELIRVIGQLKDQGVLHLE